MLSCTFRYGRQDMDVMGVAFRRDLFVVTRQVYPELQDKEKLTHTKIQQKLLRKLGDNAFPFFFEVSEQRGPPSNQQLPASNLQPSTLNTRSLSLFGVSVPRQLAMFSGSAACAQWRREGTANMSLFSDAWVLSSCVVWCYIVTSWSQWVFYLK